MDRQSRKMHRTSTFQHQFCAGVLAGGTAVLLLHPLDLLKTRFQATNTNDSSYFNIGRQLGGLARQGPQELYRGFTANLMASVVSWGTYFGLYHLTKLWWPSERPHEILISSATAGILTVFVANPLWMAKTRICQPNSSEKSLYHCLCKAWSSERLAGLYKGLVPGLAGTSHGAVHFLVYESLKNRIRKGREPFSSFSVTEVLSMSMTSKVIASTSTYPMQVIRCRMQLLNSPTTSIWKTVYGAWKNEGLRAFYKGLVPNTLRVLPGTCITFITYEKAIQWMTSKT